jgi:hypothetical protein
MFKAQGVISRKLWKTPAGPQNVVSAENDRTGGRDTAGMI